MEIEQASIGEAEVRVALPGASPISFFRPGRDAGSTCVVPDDFADLARLRATDASTGAVARPFRGRLHLLRECDYVLSLGGAVVARVVRDRGAREVKRKGRYEAFEG